MLLSAGDTKQTLHAPGSLNGLRAKSGPVTADQTSLFYEVVHVSAYVSRFNSPFTG